jgi:signal transduction histidine kinase
VARDEPLPDDRFRPEAEATAYHVATEVIRRAGATEATIHLVHTDSRLVLRVDTAAPPRGDLVDLDDRVGALGGVLRVEPAAVVAELPCA